MLKYKFIKSIISEGYAKESSDGIVTLLPEFNSNSWKQIIPKGLNEQGLKVMSQKKVYKSITETLNSIHKRLNK